MKFLVLFGKNQIKNLKDKKFWVTKPELQQLSSSVAVFEQHNKGIVRVATFN